MAFRVLCGEFMLHQRNAGAFDEHIADHVLRYNVSLLNMNGARQWWEKAGSGFSPEFTSHVEALMKKTESAAIDHPWLVADGQRVPPGKPDRI
jgi:hypothetical protein